MVLHPQVVERVLAAVVLCAALLAPSLASAHAGHAHHATATTVEQALPPAADQRVAGEPAMTTNTVRNEIARTWAPPSDRGMSNCASHCCSGTAGMTCCAAALVPEMSVAPAFTTSHALLFGRVGALLGLPPEALPKPPKSFA